MTAIGVVARPDGFVIGADGRMTLEDEEKRVSTPPEILQKETEKAQKIFKVADQNKALGYAVTGFVTIDEFNLLREIRRKMDWLSIRDFDTCKKYVASVAEKLTDEINEAKHAATIKDLPVSRRMESGDSWKIADLVVVGYFKGVASFICAQIFHTDGSKAEFDVNSVPANYRMLSGSDAVRKAMYPDNFKQPDPRFAQYAKPIIESLQDAEDYIKGYISACSSDLGRELDPESWRITGGRTHLARITPERGFEWIILP